MLGTSDATISTYGLSSSDLLLSSSVARCCDLRPESNCTPSTISTYVFSSSDSSISTTPSLPTLLYASAIILPNSSSLLAEIVATLFSILSFTSIFTLSKYVSTLSFACSTSFFIVLKSTEESKAFFKMAEASTVEVVVPSPASFTVFWAASLISLAPIFSTGSSSTTEFATVTPSLVITGFPIASS